MTQSQHTQGPWKAVFKHGQSGPDYYNIVDNDDVKLCEVIDTSTADIISAAPDMKAALIDAERWLGFLIAQEIHKDSSSPNHARQTLKRVTDAINKAEGRLAQ